MKNNCLLQVNTITKNGKKYENLYCTVELENGNTVCFQVKQAFYNRKFNTLLVKNLPCKDGGNNGDK